MRQKTTAGLVKDRLHIIDSSGDVALVFVRQRPLAGRPVELAGTSWRLLDDDATYGDGVTTLVFLHSWAAVGTTACRDYQIGYTSSNGNIRVPSTGMAGSTERCSRDAGLGESQFGEDLGWANQYAVQQVEDTELLVVRTSRGKTLTFEPLVAPAGAIFDKSWRLIRFLEVRSDGSSMRWLTDRDPEAGADITATFSETGLEGSLGCHSYAHRTIRGDGKSMIGLDGTITMEGVSLSTKSSCDNRVGITAHQQQYLDLMATAERYHVFVDRLVVVTGSGDALMFQSTTKKTETATQGRPFQSDCPPKSGNCLGPEITSGQDIFAMLSTSLIAGTQSMRSLSAEHQFELYLSNATGPEGLNEATHRCIWNSTAQLLEIDDPHTGTRLTESNLMGQLMTMMVAMPLYCAATPTSRTSSRTSLDFDEDEADYIICAIDAAGGREAWTQDAQGKRADFRCLPPGRGNLRTPDTPTLIGVTAPRPTLPLANSIANQCSDVAHDNLADMVPLDAEVVVVAGPA